MSTTPRTDAAVIASGFQAVPFGFQEFARSLEIELAEAEQIDNAANHYLSRAEKAEAEVERLFARLYKACDDERDMAISEGLGHGVCGLASELTARAEKAEAKLEDVSALLRRVAGHLLQDNPLRKQVIDYLKDRKLTGKILRAEKEANK